jgi:WD40 repeat protein
MRYRHADGEIAAVNHDGTRAALTTPNSVAVWDLGTGKMLVRLVNPDHVQARKPVGTESAPAIACVFAPDGKRLLTADGSGPIRVWDATTGKWMGAVATPSKDDEPRLTGYADYQGRVTELMECPGGECWLVRADRNFVFAMNRRDFSMTYRGVESADILAHNGNCSDWVSHYPVDALYEELNVVGRKFVGEVKDGVTAAALSPDGRLVAGVGNTVKLWKLQGGLEIHLKDPPWKGGLAGSVAFTPDSRTLLVAGRDSDRVARWELVKGERLPDLHANRGGVHALAISADGKVLVTTGTDRVIRRFDLTTGKELSGADGFAGRVVVAMAPDGRVAACGDRAGAVRVWADSFKESPGTLSRGGSPIGYLTFSADGKHLAAVHADCSARVWEVGTSKVPLVLPTPQSIKGITTHNLPFVRFSPDGNRLAASIMGGGVWAWDATTGKVEWTHRPQEMSEYTPWGGPVFTPDGKEVLLGMDFAQIVRLDASTGEELKRITIAGIERWDVADLAITPDGRFLAAHTYHNASRLVLIDQVTGRTRWRLDFDSKQTIREIAFAFEGKKLITTHNDGRLRVWDCATGKPAFELVDPAGPLGTLAVSADGTRAITETASPSALIWSLSK